MYVLGLAPSKQRQFVNNSGTTHTLDLPIPQLMSKHW